MFHLATLSWWTLITSFSSNYKANHAGAALPDDARRFLVGSDFLPTSQLPNWLCKYLLRCTSSPPCQSRTIIPPQKAGYNPFKRAKHMILWEIEMAVLKRLSSSFIALNELCEYPRSKCWLRFIVHNGRNLVVINTAYRRLGNFLVKIIRVFS